MLRLARIIAASALLAACSIDELPFRCDADRACVHAGVSGVCEANGYCSFADTDCPDSGRRYGENAPEGVKNTCVAPCVKALTLGQFHSCALLADGSFHCWGDARDGQLGNGKTSTESYSTPVDSVPELWPLSQASAGEDHTCAVTSPDGSVHCWGSNQGKQLGVLNATEPGPVEVKLATLGEPALEVVAGVAHSCARSATGLRCWGVNLAGQLGSGSTSPVSPPVAVDWKADVLAVSVGAAHTCGRPAVGRVRCWGQNQYGQVGAPLGQNQSSPYETKFTATRIALGAGHSCGLSDGKVGCFGNNEREQLGSAGPSRDTAVQVPLDAEAVGIAAGYAHSCAVLVDGRLTCWGSNLYGQLGPAATAGDEPSQPVVVPIDEPVDDVWCGREHTCAITRTGRVLCFGRNDYGQLGNGESGSEQANPEPDAAIWKSLCR